MPVATTYPGVYIEEIPSGVRTITGVATSVAAFVDYFRRGPMNTAVQLFSFADFEREFGGLDVLSDASYAIQQFFLNGGTEAWAVRVASGVPAVASVELRDGGGAALTVSAASEGLWGSGLRVTVDHGTTAATAFNLAVSEVASVDGRLVVVNQESFREVSMAATDSNSVVAVLRTQSRLIRASTLGATRPAASGTVSGAFAAPFVPLPAAAAPRRVEVTFDVEVGANEVAVANLGVAAIGSLEEVAARLEAAIRSANLLSLHWAQATVRVIGNRLQIAAGPTAPGAMVTFAGAPAAAGPPALAADPATVNDLHLTGAGVTVNVGQYQLGTVASPGGFQGPGVAGVDGSPPDATALIGTQAVDPPTGMFALDKVSIFNILCLPRVARRDGTNAFPAGQVASVVSAATTYCESRRAFFILDTPSDVLNPAQARTWLAANGTLRHRNVALYFPRVIVADPLNGFRPRSFGASGTLAGLYARTDATRGVWKAPAGTEAVLRGVPQLEYRMTDQENGALNPLAINALRFFDIYGNVCWGARTLDGSDQQASEWKYVPIRRLALFLEESLYRGTQWVVFEPNDEPLWSQIRLNIGAFMQNLFRQGAFQGQAPRDAYFVKCDGETTTQNDRNLGIVNIVVGFAPLKPAEFVIIKIQQIAGQIQT